ncbi:MAG: hypothetical protein Q8Q90_03745 [bacterium]|nr:hypothetical protein [bacterium]
MLLKAWGVPYNPAFERTPDQKCPECDWSFIVSKTIEESRKKKESVIGFSMELPFPSVQDSVVGIIILECPQCFTIFWLHITQGYAKALANICDKWPKENT